jgi:hypothetical protein
MAGPWENYAPGIAAEPAGPPTGLKPGTQGYLDWAVEQMKTGRTLPKLTANESLPEWARPSPWKTPGDGEPLTLGPVSVPLGMPGLEQLNVGPVSVPPGILGLIRSLYPFEQNVETGEYRSAVPKIVPAMIDGAIDAATLPGDVWQGKYSEELDPRYGLPNVSPELGGRILNLSTSVSTGAMPKLDPNKPLRLAQEIATNEASGFGIPLTSGQASGDLNQLRSEQLLRQTDPSQPIMRTFDDRQTEAIGAATDGIGREIGGTTDDLAGIVTAGLQEKARLAKEGADAFLDVAQDGKLKVRAAAVRALPGFVKQRLGGTVVNDTLTPAASAALREIEGANPGPGSRALSWKKLDNIRRKLAGLSGSGPEDMTATRGVKQAFDDWLSDAVDRQLFSGDEAALQALRAAGEESLQYLKINTGGDAAGATIAKMEQTGATAEQVANWLYGADVVSPGLAATEVAERLKGVFGPSSEEWKSIRAAAWNKLVNDPATGEVRSAATLTKRLDTFLDDRGSPLAGTLFSEEERNRMKALATVLKRIDLPVDARHPSRSRFALGDTSKQAIAAFIGAAGFSLGGSLGLAAAAAVPIFGRAARQAEARAAITNRLTKPLPDTLLHAPSLAARVATITAANDQDMDLRGLAQQVVQGKMQPRVDSDFAAALAAAGVTYDPDALSELERAIRPQPFLPPGMRLSQPEPDPLFQLHA